MSKIYSRSIAATQPGTSAVQIGITCPDNAEMTISLTICNDDSTARTFSLYKVPASGSAADSNAICLTESVSSKPGTHLVPQLEGNVFAEGDMLYGLSSVAATLTFSGGYTVTER